VRTTTTSSRAVCQNFMGYRRDQTVTISGDVYAETLNQCCHRRRSRMCEWSCREPREVQRCMLTLKDTIGRRSIWAGVQGHAVPRSIGPFPLQTASTRGSPQCERRGLHRAPATVQHLWRSARLRRSRSPALPLTVTTGNPVTDFQRELHATVDTAGAARSRRQGTAPSPTSRPTSGSTST